MKVRVLRKYVIKVELGLETDGFCCSKLERDFLSRRDCSISDSGLIIKGKRLTECPYCGEKIDTIILDGGVGWQSQFRMEKQKFSDPNHPMFREKNPQPKQEDE